MGRREPPFLNLLPSVWKARTRTVPSKGCPHHSPFLPESKLLRFSQLSLGDRTEAGAGAWVCASPGGRAGAGRGGVAGSGAWVCASPGARAGAGGGGGGGGGAGAEADVGGAGGAGPGAGAGGGGGTTVLFS